MGDFQRRIDGEDPGATGARASQDFLADMDAPRSPNVLGSLERLGKVSQLLAHALFCDLCNLGDRVRGPAQRESV